MDNTPAQVEYKVITTVEFLRPSWGTSVLVSQNGKIKEEKIQQTYPENYIFKAKPPTKSAIKADSVEYLTLAKIRSGGSVNYENIALNDALMTTKINDLTAEGWTLTFITSGVDSSEEGFIYSKYYFRREIN